MSNSLVIKVWKMDYSFLIKNYLNPEMWQKEWTLFEYKTYKVTLSLFSIQTRNEQILFDVRLHYPDSDGCMEYQERTIHFSLKINDVSFLKRQINSAIWDLMEIVERSQKIRQTDDYWRLQEMKDEEEDKLTEIAKEFLDKSGVTNDNLRDAYVEAYVDEYAKCPRMISDYVCGKIYSELPDLYLAWLSCTTDDPNTNFRTDLIKETIAENRYLEISKEIEEYQKYIQSDEFTEEMQSNLEEV